LRTHQLLVYVDDVNIVEDNINTMKKTPEALIDVSKDVGLKINIEKAKCILMSCY
jgi:hypothetical protein